MDIRSPLTTEYVRVAVGATVNGSSLDPTADDVQIAVVATGSTPGTLDWHDAAWETDTTTTPHTYYAVLLIGPAPGVLTLTAGSIYDAYVKVMDNPETVVRKDGAIAVL